MQGIDFGGDPVLTGAHNIGGQTEAKVQGQGPGIERLALRFPRYGYRRRSAQLQRDGLNVNHKRVLRIMRASGLLCRAKRKFVRTTDSNHAYRVYPNLYRNRVPEGPNQVWVAGITYIRLRTDFVYRSAEFTTKPCCDPGCLLEEGGGLSLSRRIDAQLTCAALKVAITSRWPSGGCIHHSDRGVQYATHVYTELLKEHGFRISMSRR